MSQRDTSEYANLPSAEGLVERYWMEVYSLAVRLCGNRSDAEDIAQETMLRALRRIDQFKMGTSMRAWVCRIATNVFLDGRRRRREVDFDSQLYDPPNDGPGVSAGLENEELALALQHAITELPDLHRVVFLLRTTEGLSFADIAPIIGTSESGARWHMMQARRDLTHRLEGML